MLCNIFAIICSTQWGHTQSSKCGICCWLDKHNMTISIAIANYRLKYSDIFKVPMKLKIILHNFLVYILMLTSHESKTTQHKFNGRKGVGDEVLKLPIGIMQDNTQVSWLATRGLVLSLRALGNKHNNMPYTGILIPGPLGTNKTTSLGSEAMLGS